jgi:hypothetical protein
MSDVPSWLSEENISTAQTVTSNPTIRNSAISAAKNLPPPPPPSRAAPPPPTTSSVYTPPVATAVQADVEAPPASNPNAGPDPSSEFIIEEQTLKSMQRWHLALRVLYMCAAIFMGVAAGLSLQTQNDVGLIFFALYVLFFCAMICCFEVNLQV